MSTEIIEGDCRTILTGLAEQSVHTCVTSPPYFGLRDYGHPEQIGLEPTPDGFVAALVEAFRAVRRVLRDDATVWLNLGDSYAGSTVGGGNGAHSSLGGTHHAERTGTAGVSTRVTPGVKPKDLIGIPWLVAFALRADGWYLRSEIIWHKPSPMPESVTDRPTKAHEQVFLLSKRPSYYYDADAIREPWVDERKGASGTKSLTYSEQSGRNGDAGLGASPPFAGRNKRSVWTVATHPYAGAHFATMPPKLIEPAVLAGCPERACHECGAPWRRIVERVSLRDRTDGGPRGGAKLAGRQEQGLASGRTGLSASNSHNASTPQSPVARTLGFEPSCDHDAPPVPGIVLDPFAGAGTTGLVAQRLGRSFTGIELNPEYAAMARDRIATDLRLGHRAPQRGPQPDEAQASIFDGLEAA